MQRDQLVIAACLVAALRESALLVREEEESVPAEDPAVTAEREARFREERKRKMADDERRLVERKRTFQCYVAQVEAGEREQQSMSKWDQGRVAAWLSETVEEWAAHLGDSDAVVTEARSDAWQGKFFSCLRRDGKAMGQCLMLAAPAKIAACCGDSAMLSEKILEAIKVSTFLDSDKEKTRAYNAFALHHGSCLPCAPFSVCMFFGTAFLLTESQGPRKDSQGH